MYIQYYEQVEPVCQGKIQVPILAPPRGSAVSESIK